MDDDDLAFLHLLFNDQLPATVVILLPDGTVSHIHNVNPSIIRYQCPLLYHAFEEGTSFSRANIEAPSRAAVVSLLRFLYTGNYIADRRLDTLLNHAQVFKLAEDFDVAALQVSAYANFTNQTELACSYATPPPDLPDTIRFLYKHLASQQSRQEQTLIDTLLNYCLTNFAYHNLAENEDFRQAICDVPECHRDLCRLSMQRNFEDDGALDLVRLPVPTQVPHSQADTYVQAWHELWFWQDADDVTPMAVDDAEQSNTANTQINDTTNPLTTLVHRPRSPTVMARLQEGASSEQENHGFTLVHRPKLNDADPYSEDDNNASTMSSPELLSDPCNDDVDGDKLVEDGWSLI